MASSDVQVKWNENNTLVIKDNLPHYNFSWGQKFMKLYSKQMKQKTLQTSLKRRQEMCLLCLLNMFRVIT